MKNKPKFEEGLSPFSASMNSDASLLSELICHNSALGRGVSSPFDHTKAAHFTSAIPEISLDIFSKAASKFRNGHEEERRSMRKRLDQIETEHKATKGIKKNGNSDPVSDATGGMVTMENSGVNLSIEIEELKEELNKSPRVLWTTPGTPRTTLLSHMFKSTYGSLAYHDRTCERLGGAMASPRLLPSELSVWSLTADTDEGVFMRSTSNTEGALLQEFEEETPTLNYLGRVPERVASTLIHKIKETDSGSSAAGHVVVLPTRPEKAVYTDTAQIYTLLDRVFRRGKSGETKVNVFFSEESRIAWTEFLQWGVDELAGRKNGLTDHQRNKCRHGCPASVELCLMVGGKAAMTRAFLERMTGYTDLPSLELNSNDLEYAKRFARVIFEVSSELYKLETKGANAAKATASLTSDENMLKAKHAVSELIELRANEHNEPFFTMTMTRGNKDIKLTQLNKLVADGFLTLHRDKNADALKKGAKRVYTFPEKTLQPMTIEDAYAIHEKAIEQYQETPELFTDSEAHKLRMSIVGKVEEAYNDPLDVNYMKLPRLPITRLTPEEIEYLPHISKIYPESFVVRGGSSPIPEAKQYLTFSDAEMVECGMHHKCATVWVRNKKDGVSFVNDWSKKVSNELTHWSE